ncbi:MAG: 3-deoxy-7-phosphoheptulonate synthase [Chlamydiae bacterium]|nr:3-deoxy-7-phosphoheptulonate synthase [Chlamydiota bacterium]
MQQKSLFSASDLKKELFLSPKAQDFIQKSRNILKNIFLKKDKRPLFIIGPCSIHDYDEAIKYGKLFQKLSKKVERNIFLVMRSFVMKPRTTKSWEGYLYDPNLDGSYDIKKGIKNTRKLLLDLTNLQIPLATEFLDPFATHYIQDLISYGIIGARTSASQTHRQLASGLQFLIGIKNSIDGNVDIALDSVSYSKNPCNFISLNEHGKACITKTLGNEFTHIVLRGSSSKPNFDEKSILAVIKTMRDKKINSPIMIDCSHANSPQKPFGQIQAFKAVIKHLLNKPNIMGLLLESNLYTGSQPFKSPFKEGVSITDPCIDFKTTEELILSANQSLSSR